jgi:hypothetical protein
LSFGKLVTSRSSEERKLRKLALPIEDRVLTVALLLQPVIVIAAAKISGGGMTYRYVLPTVLGGALAIGYLTSKAAHVVRAFLLALMFVSYSLSSIPVIKKVLNSPLIESRATVANDAKEILIRYHLLGLPIVISSGMQYLPMAFYKPVDVDGELYALTDPDAAVKFTNAKSNSVELALLALRRYFPLHVEDYTNFTSRHREFILVSDGDAFDSWPSRLAHDGDTLSLVSAEGNARVYKVSLRAIR